MGTVELSTQEEERRGGLAGVPGSWGCCTGQREEAGEHGAVREACATDQAGGTVAWPPGAEDVGRERSGGRDGHLATCHPVSSSSPAGGSPPCPCRASLAQSWCPSRVC